MRVNPIGAGEIRLSYFLYKDMNLSSEEFEKEILEYQHLISQEDQDMVPFIQKNLEAGVYHAGPLSHHWENGLQVVMLHQMRNSRRYPSSNRYTDWYQLRRCIDAVPHFLCYT